MPTEEHGGSPYRWVVVSLAFCGGLTQGLLWLSAVPMILVLEKDLGLSAAQVAVWINTHLVLTIVLSIPLGMVVDKWGFKRTGSVGVFLLTAGAMGRGLAVSYETLMVASTAFGIGFIAFFIAIPKALAAWFRSDQIGTATGVFLMGYGAGAALGMSLAGPIFGEAWRTCFLSLAWVGAAMFLAWILFARELGPRPEIAELHFGLVARKPVSWLLTAIFFFYVAGFSGWITFGFPFLVRFSGLTEGSAGLVLTATMVSYTVAALLLPAGSDRAGRRRPFFMVGGLVAALTLLSLPWLGTSVLVWAFAVSLGACFGSINPLIFTVAAESEELGPRVMGASVGLISSVGSVAGLVIPLSFGSFLGVLQQASYLQYSVVWIVSSSFGLAIAGFGALLPETGAQPLQNRTLGRPHGSVVERV